MGVAVGLDGIVLFSEQKMPKSPPLQTIHKESKIMPVSYTHLKKKNTGKKSTLTKQLFPEPSKLFKIPPVGALTKYKSISVQHFITTSFTEPEKKVHENS